jgi:rubredoxin
MKFELLIFGITGFLVMNAYYDDKYIQMLKTWKKYYQMAGIGFVGLSAYLFIKKYPQHSSSLFTHANGLIKCLPIDKNASDLLTPMFNIAQTNLFNGNPNHYNSQQSSSNPPPQQQQQHRMETSGGNGNKRSVSETKKKFVASSQDWKCESCKQQLSAWFEVDHKVRLGSGGTNHISNLVALCRECHGKKTAFENF